MDVKYVPKACYAGADGEMFYQYTMIDEASRERLGITARLNEATAVIRKGSIIIFDFILMRIC